MSHKEKLLELITKKSNVVNQSNINARLSAIDEFGKCSEEQAALIIGCWEDLEKTYGSPDCVKYKGNRRVHSVGVKPYSLHCECIRFRLNSLLTGHQVLIRLARSTTPGCKLRDPLLVYKYPDDRPNRVILLNTSLLTFEFILAAQHEDIGEFEIAPTSVPRKASTSGVMTFNEKEYLLPKFLLSIEKQSLVSVIEYKHPHGSVDVYLRSKNQNIFVELKYINKDENPLGKLRTAIGQILMYKNDPGITLENCVMWVVTNELEINKQIRQTLLQISLDTKIKFFQVHGSKLKNLLTT
jgi:hypothetical protein